MPVASWEYSEKVSFPGFDDGLDAVARLQLGQDLFDVLLDGVYTDVELGGDLPVGQIVGEKLQSEG